MANQNPGKILLRQYLKPHKLSQNALARAIGVPPRRINEIILGKRAISADTAVRLGAYFGNSAGYWMQLQAGYDIELARAKIGPRLNTIRAPQLDEALLAAESRRARPETELPTKQQRPIRKRILR